MSNVVELVIPQAEDVVEEVEDVVGEVETVAAEPRRDWPKALDTRVQQAMALPVDMASRTTVAVGYILQHIDRETVSGNALVKTGEKK